MSRTTIVFAAFFLVAGIVVALLPAQESAWRKSAVQAKEPGRFQPAEPRPLPSALRASEYATVPVASEGESSASMSDDIGPIAREEVSPEPAPGSEAAAPADDGETKSVLKRPGTLPRASAAPMPILTAAEREPTAAEPALAGKN